MTPVEVIEKIARGECYSEARDISRRADRREMARIYEQQGFGKASRRLLKRARCQRGPRASTRRRPISRATCFPRLTLMPRDVTAASLVGLMVGRFKELFTQEMQEAGRALELSPRQIVTLASLVEKETAQAGRSGRWWQRSTCNRLKIGMGMQADPTVIYALQRAGRYDGNLSRDDLPFDSPYNTYRYAGLPPGPIASPGLASLQGRCRTGERRSILYFVSRNDGSHVFVAHARRAQRQRPSVSSAVLPRATRCGAKRPSALRFRFLFRFPFGFRVRFRFPVRGGAAIEKRTFFSYLSENDGVMDPPPAVNGEPERTGTGTGTELEPEPGTGTGTGTCGDLVRPLVGRVRRCRGGQSVWCDRGGPSRRA